MFWLILIAACIAFPPFGEALLCLVLLYLAFVFVCACLAQVWEVFAEVGSVVAKVPSLFRRWLAWMNAR